MLRKLDNYLLINYPVLWRTRLHKVMIWAVLAAIVLFLAGFFYPITANNLPVDPIQPIELGYDDFYLYALAACLIYIAFWAATLYRSGYPFSKPIQTFQTLFFYAIGLILLLGFTSAAYRMGTLYKTAYYWMDEDDLLKLRTDEKYQYGFVLLKEDSVFTTPEAAFFHKRDSIFHEIKGLEDTLLAHRYDDNNSFWFTFSDGSRLNDESFKNYGTSTYSKFPSNLPFQRNLSYRYYRSDLTYHLKTLENSANSDISYIAFLLYRVRKERRAFLTYPSYRTYIAYRADATQKSRKIKFQSDQTYDNIQASLLSETDSTGKKTYFSRTPIFYPSVRAFDKAYFQWRRPETSSCDPDYITKYKLAPQTDSVLLFQDSLFIRRPAHIYQAENAVRSVLHARQFIEKAVFWRYFKLLLYYLSILISLLFLIPFVSIRQLMIVTVCCFGASVLLTFFDLNTWANKTPKRAGYVNEITFLFPMAIGLFYLLWTWLAGKQGRLVAFAYASIFIGLVIVFLGALNLNVLTSIKIGFPSNRTFYIAQVWGIASCFLINYVKTIPKSF